MDENLSIKYAVYIDKDGDDVLEVVRDTEELAKADMERLKKQTSYVRIEKANIKNFGKDDEKVIDSETIKSWDSSDGASKDNDEDLSDHYKATGNMNTDNNNGQPINQVGTVAPVAPAPIPVAPIAPAPVVEKKPETWQEYYAKHGALVYGEGWEELTKAKEVKPDVAKTDTTTIAAVPVAPPVADVTPPAPVADANTAIPPAASAIPATATNPQANPNPPTTQPQKDSGNISLSDADVDKIAEKLKEKLAQNGTNKVEPEKVIG